MRVIVVLSMEHPPQVGTQVGIECCSVAASGELVPFNHYSGCLLTSVETVHALLALNVAMVIS